MFADFSNEKFLLSTLSIWSLFLSFLLFYYFGMIELPPYLIVRPLRKLWTHSWLALPVKAVWDRDCDVYLECNKISSFWTVTLLRSLSFNHG